MVNLLVMWLLTRLRCVWESIVLHRSWVRLQLKSSHCYTRISGSLGSSSLAQLFSRDDVVNSIID